MKAFTKTKQLQHGETQTISFKLTAEDLASFNSKTLSWEAAAGSYTVKVGASSRDIRESKSFILGQKLMVEKVHDVFHPA